MRPLSSKEANSAAVKPGIRIAQIGFIVCVVSAILDSIFKMKAAAAYIFYVGAAIMFLGICLGIIRLARR